MDFSHHTQITARKDKDQGTREHSPNCLLSCVEGMRMEAKGGHGVGQWTPTHAPEPDRTCYPAACIHMEIMSRSRMCMPSRWDRATHVALRLHSPVILNKLILRAIAEVCPHTEELQIVVPHRLGAREAAVAISEARLAKAAYVRD